MALNDVVDEIKGRQKMAPVQAEKPRMKKETGQKKSMTKEEIEAYRQKKMAEEEAKYLKMAKKDTADKPAKPAKAQKPAREPKADPQEKPQKRSVQPRRPKILQPLEPLYLLRIPGLPKGDCIAICLAHGAD